MKVHVLFIISFPAVFNKVLVGSDYASGLTIRVVKDLTLIEPLNISLFSEKEDSFLCIFYVRISLNI